MPLPFIISIPHCASRVPDTIKTTMALNDSEIHESIDFGTFEIFGRLPAEGTVTARWSRLVVDANRPSDQMDAKGVVALTDYHGRSIFRPGLEPDPDTIKKRVNQFHRPYHAAVEAALRNPKAIALIDGHSLSGSGPVDAPDAGRKRKDVIISNNGDIYGRSDPSRGPLTCSPETIQVFKSAFEKQGLSVALNNPYQGGFIVRHYGVLLRSSGRFAVQIEMNHDLYMAPDNIIPDQRRIQQVYGQVFNALDLVAVILGSAAKSFGPVKK